MTKEIGYFIKLNNEYYIITYNSNVIVNHDYKLLEGVINNDEGVIIIATTNKSLIGVLKIKKNILDTQSKYKFTKIYYYLDLKFNIEVDKKDIEVLFTSRFIYNENTQVAINKADNFEPLNYCISKYGIIKGGYGEFDLDKDNYRYPLPSSYIFHIWNSLTETDSLNKIETIYNAGLKGHPLDYVLSNFKERVLYLVTDTSTKKVGVFTNKPDEEDGFIIQLVVLNKFL